MLDLCLSADIQVDRKLYLCPFWHRRTAHGHFGTLSSCINTTDRHTHTFVCDVCKIEFKASVCSRKYYQLRPRYQCVRCVWWHVFAIVVAVSSSEMPRKIRLIQLSLSIFVCFFGLDQVVCGALMASHTEKCVRYNRNGGESYIDRR